MKIQTRPCLCLLASLLLALPVYADQGREYKGKVFQLSHRSPRVLLPVLQPLTSGSQGATIDGSEETRTISVRDYPENLEAIEAAIKLLDKPDTSSRRIGLEIQISLLGASQEPSAGETKTPPALAPVVTQLQRTLNFKNYRYITTLSQRTLDRGRVGASGAIAEFFPGRYLSDKPGAYEYSLSNVSVIPTSSGDVTIEIGEFQFNVWIPVMTNAREVAIGNQAPRWDSQRTGLVTGLTLREGEQVVVGTSSVGSEDKAIIVVVSIRRT